jgi:hypothetical protein
MARQRPGPVVFLLAALLSLLGGGPALAAGPQQAGLVVVYGQGQVFSTCVTFSEDGITGAELLNRAGLRVLAATAPGMGAAICKINETGCEFPGQDCFCKCLGTPCAYWNYWYWAKGGWVFSGRGAGNRLVRDGDIDAWVWSDGNSKPPPPSSLALCAPAQPAPATAEPTLAPSPSPMAAVPTSSPAATATAPPAPSATASAAPPTASAALSASPTASAQSTPSPTDTPSVEPSATGVRPSPSPGASSAPPPASPAVQPTPPPPAGGGSPLLRYGSFALLVVVLLGLIGYASWRKRKALR